MKRADVGGRRTLNQMLASASLKLPLFRVGGLRAPVRFYLVILTRIEAAWRENPESTSGGQGQNRTRPARVPISRQFGENSARTRSFAVPNFTMVARDRIELPTRGFSVLVTPFQPSSFNNLAGSLPDYCTTARNRAPLIHAKFTQGL